MPTKLVLPLLVVLQDESGRYVMTNTSVSDPNQDLYYSYEYDTYGNIRSAEAHGSYHTSDNYTNDYEYNNPKWLDLLTGFNTEPILYEGQTLVDGEIVGDPTSGNPISYFNGTRWEFTWQNGRQLASASTTDGDTTIDIDYTYDINGLRTSKTITRTTGSGTAHTHEYTSTVTAPTCTTAGYTTYTCECGESYVDNLVDALGHNYVQSGNVYTCSRCGDSYTGHEHSYTESTTEPTCTQAGYTTYTCSCGDSYTVDLPALGHDYVLVSQNGNVATYQCSRCGHRYTAVVPVDPQPPVEYGLRNGNVVVTTEHHEYLYASGKLLREVITTTDEDGNVTTEVLDFTYDTSGSPYTLTRTVGTTSSTYYYVVNLQGDVMRLVAANGATVAEYWYDPWGRVLSASGTMAEVNPLRYRGYYYDAESEFYYLQSRYYDPAICRFVNADGYASTGQGFLGQNMFAYCNNSPINHSDTTGHAIDFSHTYVDSDCGIGIAPDSAPESAPIGDPYWDDAFLTPDEAALDFVRRSYGHSIEYGALIYRKTVNGVTHYVVGSKSEGTNCIINISPDNKLKLRGWEEIGSVHTDPQEGSFSDVDLRTLEHNLSINSDYVAYVASEYRLPAFPYKRYVLFRCDAASFNSGGKFASYFTLYVPSGGRTVMVQESRIY